MFQRALLAACWDDFDKGSAAVKAIAERQKVSKSRQARGMTPCFNLQGGLDADVFVFSHSC